MYGDDYPSFPSEGDRPRYRPDDGPRSEARAITWQDALFGRGGGGGGPGGKGPETTWLGRKFRDWACKLIDKEKSNLNTDEKLEPKVFEQVYNRRKELAKEFNRLNDEPGIDVTMAAVDTLIRYNFGLTVPSLQKS